MRRSRAFFPEKSEGFAFVGLSTSLPITPKHLSALVAGYVARSEVGKDGSCHLFGHTCATLMLEHGADIRHVQE